MPEFIILVIGYTGYVFYDLQRQPADVLHIPGIIQYSVGCNGQFRPPDP